MFYLAGLFRKSCKRLAWWASYILSPLRIFKWTGILPYRTISYEEFATIPFRPDAQGVMDEQKPLSIQSNKIWSVTPPSDLVMSHVLSIRGGIADHWGNVFDPVSGKLISGATHKYRYKIKRVHIPQPQCSFSHVEHILADVAVFTASNQHIYWHWLLDVMPRLIMLDEMAMCPQIIYLQKKLPFQHDMLEFMGVFPKMKIINCDEFPMISATTLLVPCHQIMEGRQFPKWVYQGLCQRFLPFSKEPKLGSFNRIYISRAASSQRRITNEEELIPILRDYGFQIIKLEELNFNVQMGIFSNAEVVVAPNGSGLANLVFCSKGTTVIEIFPNVHEGLNNVDFTFNFDYNYRLARSLDLDYYFVCSNEGNPNSSKAGDYSLRPKDLILTLDLAKVI